MAVISKGGTLADTNVQKNDIYALIDNATVSSIVNADISASAAIADTKLAQITTASKVSGAALTSLSSIPAGAGAIPAANLTNAGAIVQIVNTQTGSVNTGSTLVPLDDTIPQNTEGDEYMTLAVTPTSATNKLKIDVTFIFSSSTVGGTKVFVCLFQDATADALAVAVGGNESTNNGRYTVTFSHYMTAGTTSETTFKVRAGSSDAGTLTFNGGVGSREMGGKLASSITITEIRV